MRRQAVIPRVGTAALVVIAIFAFWPSWHRPALHEFDPTSIAAREVDMWQAYYRKENVRLFGDLVALLRAQYGFSWAGASLTAFYMARPAARFAVATGDYERVVPDLQRAYARIRARTRAGFDPNAVAKAELAWWVARRDPASSSVEHVGRLVAEENALLFGVPVDRVLAASTLRARAGRLRDEGGAQADWATLAAILEQSYRQLHEAVQP